MAYVAYAVCWDRFTETRASVLLRKLWEGTEVREGGKRPVQGGVTGGEGSHWGVAQHQVGRVETARGISTAETKEGV